MNKAAQKILLVINKLISGIITFVANNPKIATAILFFGKLAVHATGAYAKKKMIQYGTKYALIGLDKGMRKMAVKHLLVVVKVMQKVSNVLSKAAKHVERLWIA